MWVVVRVVVRWACVVIVWARWDWWKVCRWVYWVDE